MIPRVELIVRRGLVKAFIEADKIGLVLFRAPEPTKTAAGGYVRGPATQVGDKAQLARIVQNKRRYTNGIVNSEAGEILHTDYLIVGMHTLDLAVDDTFVWLGENYHVTGIYKARTESTLASIDLLGATNRNG